MTSVLLLLLFSRALAGPQAGRDLRVEPIAQPSNLPGGPTRWAVVIGVSKYKNVPPHAQLRFAHRDAEEFARFLRSPQGGALSSEHVRLLTDESATVGSIRATLRHWLPQVSRPSDMVYIFFAGHGVIAEKSKGYFVAHDSDPQNLHATGLSFDEVNQALSDRVRGGLGVLLADACHAGSIGWASNPQIPSRAQNALEAIGGDRSLLKLLASRPTERSYEDEKWDGGHGVFTYALLRGLRGAADRERDGVITAAELIEYVSKLVPEQTGTLQNPRVAGNFEARAPLAITLGAPAPAAPATVTLNLRGPAGSAIYIDDEFRGIIRTNGELRVERLNAGTRRLSVDVPGEAAIEHTVTLASAQTTLDLNRAPEYALARLQGLVRRGRVLDAGGAWDLHRTLTVAPEHQALADALIVAGLENTGQECVNDYVQSTAGGLKRAMLLRAVSAYEKLRAFRPSDVSVVMKGKFCQGRAEIAGGQFAAAVESLRGSLAIDSDFACAHNALGVALLRLNRPQEARAAFETAARLTPEWSLPFLQIAQQLLSAGNLAGAVPYLEKAVQYNPRSIQSRWNLLRAYRLAGRAAELEAQAKEMIALEANYAPTYFELAMHYEAQRDFARAAQAFDTYLLLAPNYADSADVRARAARNRGLATQRAPTLLRQEEKKK
jgi:tetratricopeptide (TPR) repeat protein